MRHKGEVCMKVNSDVIMPVVLSFFISVVLSPIVIPFLKKLKIGQTVREEGVQSHKVKNGTPTMGGLIILVGVVVTTLVYLQRYPDCLPILFVTLGFGIIGFLDDYIKVVMRRSEGLTPLQKLSGQMIVTTIFVYYMLNYTQMDFRSLKIPFLHGQELVLPMWLAVLLVYFVVLGTVNGVNFTDGLDGLATSVTVLVAVFFSVVAIGQKSGIEPITCAAVGSLLGFLLFNVHPAKVFMGDTGSLALGGFVAATAYVLRLPVFILLVGMIYFVEVLSVMLQVVYFKLTGGRRIFKMAPIHHHFELCGWSETRVVTVFSVITAILCLMGLVAL